MQTEQRTKKIRIQVERTAPSTVDPETLWLDQSVEPEQLIRSDPLEISTEMERQAEQPELADFRLQGLPAWKFTLRFEELEMKTLRAALSGVREPLESFVARIWGKGSI